MKKLRSKKWIVPIASILLTLIVVLFLGQCDDAEDNSSIENQKGELSVMESSSAETSSFDAGYSENNSSISIESTAESSAVDLSDESEEPSQGDDSDLNETSEYSDEEISDPQSDISYEDSDSAESSEPAHVHEWEEATCTSAKTCATCGKTEGSANGHDWKEADCDTPKTCKTCGVTDGAAAGHNWKAATCTVPKTCKVCGATNGSAKGHDWKAATCTSVKTCKTCGTTNGSAKGHSWKAATCTAPKTCKSCGKAEGTANGHSYNSRGTCTVCGAKDPDYVETIIYGDSPVVVLLNGVEYSLTSWAQTEALIPFETAEEGYTIEMRSGRSYIANGDGTWICRTPNVARSSDVRERKMSANQVANVFRNSWCRTCGVRVGDGTHGTCVKYLHATECYECGKWCEKTTCHTCDEG